MALDLDLRAEIVGAATIREADGLAMSSRNAYLTAEERRIAPVLHATLRDVAAALRAGTPAEAALASGEARIGAAGFALDYLALRAADTLEPLTRLDAAPARLLVAARIGSVRLIDNIAV
jgi:pantoate--beta-alanine ligase